MDQVEEIKQKTDIVALVSEYVTLKRAGRNFKGLCPFHGEKSPSFMVNPELQIYKCFGCGEGGDVYSWLQKMEGMNFAESLQYLAKRAGVTLASYKPTSAEADRERLLTINQQLAEAYHYMLVTHASGKLALEYLHKRGITDEAIETYKIGFVPEGWDFAISYLTRKKQHKPADLERLGLIIPRQNASGFYDRFRNRIMFPLTNARGQVVGFSGRIMPGADDRAGGKYINSPETELYHKSEMLYGFDQTRSEIKRSGIAIVTEGELDMIAAWQAGTKNVVAIKGSALTERQVQLLARVCETVVMALDGDAAGDAANRRGIMLAEKGGMFINVVEIGSKAINPEGYKDPGDWATAKPDSWVKAVEKAIPVYDFFLDSAEKRFGLEPAGKKKIGQELLPIWQEINDDIVRAHYVQKLATVLGVGEEVIRGQMAKLPKVGETKTVAQTVSAQAKVENAKQTEREIREQQLVGLAILMGRTEELATPEIAELIQSSFWKRVAETLAVNPDIQQLPAELQVKTEEIMFTDVVPTANMWTEALERLEMVGIEERLEELTRSGDENAAVEMGKLAKRKAELTKMR